MNLLIKLFLIAVPLGSFARVISSRKPRLTLAESPSSYYYTNIDGHPNTYAFGYDIRDPNTGNYQFRNEERYPNGTIAGHYGYIDGNGKTHSYRYIADKKGYRVTSVLPRVTAATGHVYNTPEMESSVTWSKTDKHKKNFNKNYITKLEKKKGN